MKRNDLVAVFASACTRRAGTTIPDARERNSAKRARRSRQFPCEESGGRAKLRKNRACARSQVRHQSSRLPVQLRAPLRLQVMRHCFLPGCFVATALHDVQKAGFSVQLHWTKRPPRVSRAQLTPECAAVVTAAKLPEEFSSSAQRVSERQKARLSRCARQ